MKRLTQNVIILAIVLAVFITGGGFANAGDINSNEKYVIKEASGTFVYEGVKYKAAKWAMDELIDKLSSDEYDLTADEAQRAIIKMYDSIEEGVKQGAIVPITKNTKKTAMAEEPEKKPYIIDSENSTITFLDEEGNEVLIADLPVKNVSENAINSSFTYYSEIPDIIEKYSEITSIIKTYLFIVIALLAIGIISVIVIKNRNSKLSVVSFCVLGIIICIIFELPKFHYLADYKTAENVLSEQIRIVEEKSFAELSINSQNVDCKVFYGDSNNLLKNGVGMYAGSSKPGEEGAILIGGAKKYLGNIANLKKYDIISITIGEDVFSYQVNRVMEDEPGLINKEYLNTLGNGEEILVLYTEADEEELRTYAICDKIQNGLENIDTEESDIDEDGFLKHANKKERNIDLWERLAEMSYKAEMTELYQRHGITENTDFDQLSKTLTQEGKDAVEDIKLEIERLKESYMYFNLSEEVKNIRKDNISNCTKLIFEK